jgi:hypothetical protein
LARFYDGSGKQHKSVYGKLTSAAAMMFAWAGGEPAAIMETGMLSQVYLGTSFSREPEMDLHRHAIFSCWRSRMAGRIAALWRSRTN